MVKWGADGKEGSMLSGPLLGFLGSRPCFHMWVSFVFVWLWKWLQAGLAYMLIIPKPEFPEHILSWLPLEKNPRDKYHCLLLVSVRPLHASECEPVGHGALREAGSGSHSCLRSWAGALSPKWGREDVLTGQNGGVCSLFSNIFLKCLEFKYLLLENLIWMASSINEPFGLLIDDYEA